MMSSSVNTKEKVRILVLSSTYPTGRDDTSPRFVHELCKGLAQDNEVRVVCPHVPGAKHVDSIDEVEVFRFRYAPQTIESLAGPGGIMSRLKEKPGRLFLVPLFSLSFLLATLKHIRVFKPHVIHAHWIVPQGVLLWLLSLFLKLPPVVVTAHGSDFWGFNSRLGYMLKKAVMKMSSAFTVVSSAMYERAVGEYHVPRSKLWLAPMGTHIPLQVCASERVPGRILYVGRLTEGKGVRHLVHCMPGIVEHVPYAALYVIGEGPLWNTLVDEIQAEGLADKVTLLGAIPHEELQRYYQAASLLCAPYVAPEGLGLVTIEAISNCCPVLVGDIPSQYDVIPEEFRERLMFNPADQDAFINRVVTALRAPYGEPIVAKLAKHARETFAWDRVIENYAHIVRQVAEPNERQD